MIRILIIDDQPLVREGLTSLLSLQDGIEVLATGENGLQALALVEEYPPDVVLMDVRMPVLSGIEATRALKARSGPPVILLTTFEEEEDMIAGIRVGAAGYLFKTAEIGEIYEALKRVVAGQSVISPRVTAALAEALSQPRLPASIPLTGRELEVLQAVASGQSNKHISRQLNITEGTVKVHMTNVMSKLDAANRTDAVRIARIQGILAP